MFISRCYLIVVIKYKKKLYNDQCLFNYYTFNRNIITFFFTLNICTIMLNSIELEPGATIFIPEPNVDIATSVGLFAFTLFVQFLIKKTLDSLIILKTSHYQNSNLTYTILICDITDVTG